MEIEKIEIDKKISHSLKKGKDKMPRKKKAEIPAPPPAVEAPAPPPVAAPKEKKKRAISAWQQYVRDNFKHMKGKDITEKMGALSVSWRAKKEMKDDDGKKGEKKEEKKEE